MGQVKSALMDFCALRQLEKAEGTTFDLAWKDYEKKWGVVVSREWVNDYIFIQEEIERKSK